MAILTKKQQRKAEKLKLRQDNKTRQKLERAMRENGSLGRLIAVQAALRRRETAEAIHRRIQEHEAVNGKITKYEALRAIVQTVLSEAGVDHADVIIKFQFGPGCGECNHSHGQGYRCAFPGCDCRTWAPARLLGIAAAPAPDVIQEAARQAGVEDRIGRPA